MDLMDHGCPWCQYLTEDARWPACACRSDCGVPQCLPNFPAADVTPGMAIHHPDGCSSADSSATSGVLDVIAVAGPDADGFMHLVGFHETVTVAADWPVAPYSAADADFEAFLLIYERGQAA